MESNIEESVISTYEQNDKPTNSTEITGSYSEEFQFSLLVTLVKNHDIAAEVIPLLHPIFFSKEWFSITFIIIEDFFLAYNDVPKSASEMFDHQEDMLQRKKKKIEKTAEVQKLIPFMFKFDRCHEYITVDKIFRFIRKMTVREALKKSINLVMGEKYDDIPDIMSKAISVGTGISKTTLSDHLQNKQLTDNQREAGLLGYRLQRFTLLASHLDGIQKGFYFICAETSCGKTATATNIFLDALQTNAELSGLYFSLDDNKDVIINRFLAILSGLDLNMIQRKQDTAVAQEILDNAYKTLIQMHKDGKLDIKDISEVQKLATLEALIKKHPNRSNLIVVIDGLYNLPVTDKPLGQREDNILRANKIKAIVDTYGIPVICTGELTKKSRKVDNPDMADIMESGKFAYNANAVLLLYPENRAEYKTSAESTIVIDYGKNKLSNFKGFQHVLFRSTKGIIEEIHGFKDIDSSNASLDQLRDAYLKAKGNK